VEGVSSKCWVCQRGWREREMGGWKMGARVVRETEMDGKGIAYPRRRQNCLQAWEIRYPTVEYGDRGIEEGEGMS
jgi:hypothetical protein